jgi:hypothetical protein
VVAVLAGALAGCSTAPPAAIVNGTAISVPQLDAQLEAWAASPAFVQAQDQVFEEQAEQESESAGQEEAPDTVLATLGSGPNEYSSVWAAMELSNMITSEAIRQHLAQLHRAPSAIEVVAAWQSEYASAPSVWRQLSAATRASAAEEDADHALVDGALSTSSQDKLFYKDNKSYFWSQVCVTADDISVPSPGGGVDMAASLKAADAVAAQLSGHGNGSVSVTSGALYCDTPEKFIEQPTNFQDRVGTLAPGQTTVLPESYGYQVVLVRSRSVIAYSTPIADDIEISATHGGSQTPPSGDSKVIDILLRANVRVDPQFGAWATTLTSPCAPEVVAVQNTGNGACPA